MFVDPNLPNLSPEQRRTVFQQMAGAEVDGILFTLFWSNFCLYFLIITCGNLVVLVTLAHLHNLNPSSVALESFGRPDAYCRNQASMRLISGNK